jgi:phosphatidylserine/phosphatidylglycerophosphate/cardiolipin synthase-like enzyme
MSCFTTTWVIAEQLWQWVLAIFSFLENICTTITEKIQQLQQEWQTQCTQVTSTVQEWQQQWQNQCSQVTSKVCNSLPWPLSAVCGWVTSTICNLVSVLILVAVVVVQIVCAVVSVLILVVATIVQVLCTLVMMVVEAFVLVLSVVLVTIFFVSCVIIPCRNPMESSFPPDNGWIVTLGLPTPPKLSANNQVRILPDGQSASQHMIEAIGAATQTIHLIQLDFDSDFIATFMGTTPVMSLVCAFLNANERGVRIRILMNDNLFADSLPQLQTAFAGHPTIELAGIRIQALQHLGVLHSKGMFIDSTVAFIDGLPFTQGYWDTQSHFVSDVRRGSGPGGEVSILGEVGNGVGDKPAHTVSLELIGPAATDVDATFVSLWNSVSSDMVTVPAPAPGLGQQSIQIVRTAPTLSDVGFSNEKGVLEAYLRAINNARSFIYMEVQYFTSPVIGAALARALTNNPALQLILLANENPDMPTYKFWQNQFLDSLSAFSARIGVFCLWRTTLPERREMTEIMQCYLEAKVSVVDDVWATVGSANLDGASLGHIFEFLPSPLSCLSASNGWRNVELNAVFYDGIGGQPATGEVAVLREVVWKEHLGLEEIPADPPAGGWLAFWNTIAAQNLASLNASQSMPGNPDMPSRILPYAAELQSEDQLNQLGVNTSLLNVAPVVPPAGPNTLVVPPCKRPSAG